MNEYMKMIIGSIWVMLLVIFTLYAITNTGNEDRCERNEMTDNCFIL